MCTLVGKRLESVKNWTVTRASAEVAIELILHLLRARLRFTIKQPAHTHDNSGGTEAALRAMVSDNGRLHGVQAVAHGADAFNCGDALAIDGAQGHQARVRRRVLEQHRAGAAAPLATAQLEPL